MTDEQSDDSAADENRTAANTLWGGRFAGGASDIMQQINASIDFDRRFYRQDIAGSRAHCSMLVVQGILTAEDGHAILKGLDQIEAEIAASTFAYDPLKEDIHMHVEARLSELIGEAAGRLHTARSRNDQVATDFRLWLRDEVDAEMTQAEDFALNHSPDPDPNTLLEDVYAEWIEGKYGLEPITD